ncbi:MAG: fibronectin type III domain-containing protein [Candidatus Promineifilaceae bacterium]|nr:fibronectin type III domain-containing protein [Candidatus Promineifilaceae bacterium]
MNKPNDSTNEAQTAPNSGDTGQLLQTLNDVFDTFQKQLQSKVPEPAEGQAAEAAKAFDNLVAEMALNLGPPLPPENFQAINKGSEIELSWTIPPGFTDGYVLSRGKSGGGQFQEIARLANDQQQYVDRELGGYSTYLYRLHAFNARGNSPFAEAQAKK